MLGCDTNKNDDDDIIILQESVKVGFRCPITLVRIKQPVRSKKCKHASVGIFNR
jgi:SUMO ligase MMS21 Smc5/6 complex component